ncbi:MAG TPA: phenylalanine--tRNA ligase subunit alpha [Cryomorphaceae bacterium]|nr:phenylalanine--tRNA ligase subunit alpha [Cryomorphaceae bacterium]HCY25968.1 phenylalanine--tRNA ligase subunit alpha [Cryomorphaceae bacterium]|tara:strand:- start:4967 stop:5983 length:1017 start_codon:yes stop_codon:yes gene_type:complete
MLENVQNLQNQIESTTLATKEDADKFKLTHLSKKGSIQELFKAFREVPPAEKKAFGAALNALKQLAEQRYTEASQSFESESVLGENGDLTRSGNPHDLGSIHPINAIKDEILDIFKRIGFNVSTGPEVEDDWHNFTALNFPEEHPARDMQDTFFVQRNPDWALRTHTSSVQVRAMENVAPPIRTISPGRVFRNEAISSRSHCVFHQIEGLYIDKDVSFADLKQVLMYFAQEFFGKAKIRMRPSYFPFTEPSAEVDVYWGLENEIDHKITKGTGWLEVMGCGMVDPNVLKANGIDPDIYTGYAFGMGIERIAMNRYQIPDIRLFTENDKRFLSQFKTGL